MQLKEKGKMQKNQNTFFTLPSFFLHSLYSKADSKWHCDSVLNIICTTCTKAKKILNKGKDYAVAVLYNFKTVKQKEKNPDFKIWNRSNQKVLSTKKQISKEVKDVKMMHLAVLPILLSLSLSLSLSLFSNNY